MEKDRRPECPFVSENIVCAQCGGPFNVDGGAISITKEVLSQIQPRYFRPFGRKVTGGILGGRCDFCGHTVGLVLEKK